MANWAGLVLKRGQAPHRSRRSAVTQALSRRWAHIKESAEAGMTTAEYAVGTLVACGQGTPQSRLTHSSKYIAYCWCAIAQVGRCWLQVLRPANTCWSGLVDLGCEGFLARTLQGNTGPSSGLTPHFTQGDRACEAGEST
ncbi:DUF4244 domain-containing protein [Knoellia sp. S7-12]|uniref:DUF4244 domain-containing protein n=1 Tax=Knoellia sp. S7-12 TaxID=3126698 RepID=UPI0033683111